MKTTSRKPLHKVQRKLVEAVQAEFDRTKIDVALAKPMGPEVTNAITAQNVLRTCIEATLEKMMPYGPSTLADMALRLASYAISAAKEEDQSSLIATVMALLPQEHARRVSEGIRISTEWVNEDGTTRSNYRIDDADTSKVH